MVGFRVSGSAHGASSLKSCDRNARFAEQFKAAAQHHELAADLADGLAIVLPEVGYGLEVRHQPGRLIELAASTFDATVNAS